LKVERLARQPVDQIEVDRAEARFARLARHPLHQLEGLDAVHRALHLGLEVLHAERDAVEAELAQELHRSWRRMAWIHFDRALAVGGARQAGIERPHERGELLARKEVGRAAAPVQLADLGAPTEKRREQLEFALEVGDILARAAVVARHDLVAAAVVANALAEGQMHIDRQRLADAADIALGEPLAKLVLAERLDEAVGRRIRRIARPAHIVRTDEHRVDDQFGCGVIH